MAGSCGNPLGEMLIALKIEPTKTPPVGGVLVITFGPWRIELQLHDPQPRVLPLYDGPSLLAEVPLRRDEGKI